MSILIVDDEPFALKLLARQLENLGYRDIIAYEQARAALGVLEGAQESIGLIFLDLQMPDMDGVEFVRHLVRIGYDGGVVLVSGEEERIVQSARRLAQAHDLDILGAISKPVPPERLREVLDGEHLRPVRQARVRRSYGVHELDRAIGGGELEIHYQPKVQLATGAVTGAEALVRWRHPEHGLVPPNDFVPLVEEHGLIFALTRAVLLAATAQARTWRSRGLDLQVAVNVSMDCLGALDFPEVVLEAIQNAELPPTGLMIEVTESRLMRDPRAALDILTRLRLKRIGLSIDDFGTGHSSLAQLRDLPFEELKIDRGFAHGAWRDAALAAILNANLSMARQLGLKTVAEGVEDRADWDFLRANGCDVAQGYFIGRPMNAEAFDHWLDAWPARYSQL